MLGYDAQDPKKVYAIKTISKQKLNEHPKNLTNLTNEIVIMSEMRSPYIVALLNATKTANSYYLAMELCNGGDLENFVKKRGGYLQEEEARLILRQIVQGIAAIKTKEVMHRDLKLPNIMLNFKDHPNDVCTNSEFSLDNYIKQFNFADKHRFIQCKIADLGFARKLSEEQLAETNCGTPLIMAPEVLRGDPYDHRADVWSLGCLYYEMLTGFAPFTGMNLQNLQENIARGTYQIPKTIRLSTVGLEFLNSCLKYNPDERLGWQ